MLTSRIRGRGFSCAGRRTGIVVLSVVGIGGAPFHLCWWMTRNVFVSTVGRDDSTVFGYVKKFWIVRVVSRIERIAVILLCAVAAEEAVVAPRILLLWTVPVVATVGIRLERLAACCGLRM